MTPSQKGSSSGNSISYDGGQLPYCNDLGIVDVVFGILNVKTSDILVSRTPETSDH